MLRAIRKNTGLLLDKTNNGTRFVTLVVAMMATLATIALGGALFVGALRAGWVDAVRGQITVEIPASDATGLVRNADALAQTAEAMAATLRKTPGVADVHVLSGDDVRKLVEPWLGQDAGTDDLPLPVLIGVTLQDSASQATATQAVGQAVTGIDAAATTETHQSWLHDLRRFSLVLLLAAGAMAATTIACCIVSVAGAVTARLSEHQADIDLLHLMGATDDYIARQFVQLIVRSVGGAAIAGTLAGLVLLKAGSMGIGTLENAALASPHIGLYGYLWFAALPALITGLCHVAARITVLRSLRVMP